jgi:hypothetical protein
MYYIIYILISGIVFNLYFIVFLGVDTWLRFHTRMLVSILGFSRTPIACKHKFNAIYKQYKNDKVAKETLGDDRHECPFYDALDCWWH